MAMIYLIRHGEPEAGWSHADDPGLSEKGHAQARAAAARLDAAGVRFSLTSPMLRCRQTAAAFAAGPRAPARVTAQVSEIPTPPEVEDRVGWLREVLARAWSDVPTHLGWRAEIVQLLQAQTRDVAIFTHFVAINAAVGAAVGSDTVLLFRPAHASITLLERTEDGRLLLLEKGDESAGGAL
jgi:broad specificity phosphatase PhoE